MPRPARALLAAAALVLVTLLAASPVAAAIGAPAEAAVTTDTPTQAAAASGAAAQPAAVAEPVSAAVAPEPADPVFGALALPVGAAFVFLALVLALRVVLTAPPGSGDRSARPPAAASAAGDGRHRPPALAALARRASDVAGRTLERRGLHDRVDAALEQAGIDLRPGEVALLGGLAAGVAGALGFLLGGAFLACCFAAFVGLGVRLLVVRKRERRLAAFADQLPDLLRVLSAALRAGYALPQAIDAAAHETEAPTRDELRRVNAEIRLGRDVVEALDAVADRTRNDDIRWLAGAIAIHREVGGDIGHVLDAVQHTILGRDHLRREVKALSAEGRTSAKVLVFLPIGVALLQSLVNPRYLPTMVGSAGGLVLLGTTIGLVAAGTIWMGRVIRPQV